MGGIKDTKFISTPNHFAEISEIPVLIFKLIPRLIATRKSSNQIMGTSQAFVVWLQTFEI